MTAPAVDPCQEAPLSEAPLPETPLPEDVALPLADPDARGGGGTQAACVRAGFRLEEVVRLSRWLP